MGLLDELKKHISETYDTLSGGRAGQRAKGLIDMVEGNVREGLPLLDKNPRDWQADDILNVVMGGTIAGRTAKTLKPRTVELADDMKAKGASRDEIWNATGEATGQPAFYDKDGNFKWEIDDSGAKYLKPGLSDMPDFGLQGQFLDHKPLYDAYPDAKIIGIEAGLLDGNTLGRQYGNTIELNTNRGQNSVKSTNLHELSHGIQDMEGLPRGGNTGAFQSKYDVDQANLDYYKGALKDEYSKLNEVPEYKAVQEEISTALDTMDMQTVRPLIDKRNSMEPFRIKDLQGEIYRLEDSVRLTPYDQYQRLAGEADARAVQKRMDMTMEQRKDKPFYKDYDLPEDEFIYRYGLLDTKGK